jgi:hypothetical protein
MTMSAVLDCFCTLETKAALSRLSQDVPELDRRELTTWSSYNRPTVGTSLGRAASD